jgi:hypothetical protein
MCLFLVFFFFSFFAYIASIFVSILDSIIYTHNLLLFKKALYYLELYLGVREIDVVLGFVFFYYYSE